MTGEKKRRETKIKPHENERKPNFPAINSLNLCHFGTKHRYCTNVYILLSYKIFKHECLKLIRLNIDIFALACLWPKTDRSVERFQTSA